MMYLSKIQQKNFDISIEFPVMLGKEIDNEPFYADFSKISHLFISGDKHTGKTNLIHQMILEIISLVPASQRIFKLIDFSGVEFSIYEKNKFRVIDTLDKAFNELSWCVEQLECRRNEFEQYKISNINTFYKKSKVNRELYPRVFFIIDDIYVFLHKFPKQFEDLVIKILHRGEEFGIHLIMSLNSPYLKKIPISLSCWIRNKAIFRTVIPQSLTRFNLDLEHLENGSYFLCCEKKDPKLLHINYMDNNDLFLNLNNLC